MALARFLACRARLASASLMASLAATTRSRAFHALEPTGLDWKAIVVLLLPLAHHNLTLAGSIPQESGCNIDRPPYWAQRSRRSPTMEHHGPGPTRGPSAPIACRRR